MFNRKPESDSLAKQFTRDYFIVSFIPLILSFIIFVGLVWVGMNNLSELMHISTNELNMDAEKNLQKLGEEVIKAKSEDTARQIELYIRMHPDKRITEMRKDPYFMKLAIQKVGVTGYTAITEARTYLFRVHPNSKLNDTDMRRLSKLLPSWWKIVEGAIDGEPFQGYYDWKDPDGSIRKKYIAVTPVAKPLHGITLMVSATTYIDEFSIPVKTMREKSEIIQQNYNKTISRRWIIFIIIAALIFSLTFFGIFHMGKKSGLRFMIPITRLAETAIKFGRGDWTPAMDSDDFNRPDEIGALMRAFKQMSEQLKDLFEDLEQRVQELRETQMALKTSEEHYRSLFSGVPIGLYRTAPDGTGLDANPTLVKMLGFPDRDSLLNTNASTLYIDRNDRKKWQKLMMSPVENKSYHTRMRRYDGAEIWVENNANAVLDENGTIQYYEGSLKDITEQKEAEEALKKSEERFKELYEESKKMERLYRSLIHSSADAIVIYDLNGKVSYVSPMFTLIFGWHDNEIKGDSIPYIIRSGRAEIEAIFRNVIDEGTPNHGFEAGGITRDGKNINLSISASRYDDHDRKPAGMLVVLRDISDRKRLEAQLHHAERLEAIGTLAGGIAHDFNNLLMVIQGSISVLLYGLDPSDPAYRNFKNIEKQVNRGSQLTKQLLGYARKGKYEVHPLNINKVITESLEAFSRTRKDIIFKYKLFDDIHIIEADIYQIEQVLMNLYINAFDAMPDGGEILIETRNSPSEEVFEKTGEKRTGDFVMISILDSGTGMDRKVMDRIFEPFFTTKGIEKGTGLGLASAYGIIRSHEGYINVESETGKGTKFTIYLPASDKEIIESIPEPKKTFTGNGTILFIDDEEMVLEAGSLMLEALGYTILKAGNVHDAIQLLNDKNNTIDLVLLDMIMPDINGSQAFDMIKEIRPDISVILSSGYSIDGKAQEIMNKGCDGFIQKPYNMEDLSEKIKLIIEGSE